MNSNTNSTEKEQLVQKELSGFFVNRPQLIRPPLKALINKCPFKKARAVKINKSQICFPSIKQIDQFPIQKKLSESNLNATKPINKTFNDSNSPRKIWKSRYNSHQLKPRITSPIISKTKTSLKRNSINELSFKNLPRTELNFKTVKSHSKTPYKATNPISKGNPQKAKSAQKANKSKRLHGIEWVAHEIRCRKGKQFPEIGPRQMVRVLRGEMSRCFDRFVIVDCRFSYEFNGGHIRGALNVPSKESVQRLFKYASKWLSHASAFFFHCEFSSQRAPTLARYFRQIDRQHSNYPEVHFPLVFVLEGGYKRLFQYLNGKTGGLCIPEGYVSMFSGPFGT